ncbi:MAG TPA: FAD-dependent oxidoreductase [Anaerolineales bacterium]|nr:FAD-dependent oxidoreductase [Anaerolineales bacterium]
MEYVILGSGVAGVAAVEAIRQQDPAGRITLVTEDAFGYYSRPGLAYYLTGELDEKLLFPFQEQDFKRLNIRWVVGRVERLALAERAIRLHDGQQLAYDRLLLAVGAQAAQLNLPGCDLQGVLKLDNLADARSILQQARRGRRAVVIGGGITALELVEGLVARRVKTHYFLRGERYWSNVLDETESRIIEQRLKEEGVQIHYHTELGEIIGKSGRIAGVRTKKGETLACDLLAVAIGIRPRLELVQDTPIKTERGILVNEHLETNVPGVFAAGDVAQVYDPLSGKSVLDSLWGPAREQGFTAGLNMAGRKQAYHKSAPFNVTRLANLTTTIIGAVGRGSDRDLLNIARGDSETWRELPDAIASQSDFDVNRLRVMIDGDKLIGAIVMGDQTLSSPLNHLIREQVSIQPIHGRLMQPDAPLADILAEFWGSLRGANANSRSG